MADRRPFTRLQRTTIINGMLAFVLMLVLLQLWLLTATMNAYLGGDEQVFARDAARADTSTHPPLGAVFAGSVDVTIAVGDGRGDEFGRAVRQLHGAEADRRNPCAVRGEYGGFCRLHLLLRSRKTEGTVDIIAAGKPL